LPKAARAVIAALQGKARYLANHIAGCVGLELCEKAGRKTSLTFKASRRRLRGGGLSPDSNGSRRADR